MARREILIWMVAAALAAIAIDWRAPSPLTDDSYQYLNVAWNVSHGRGISTSLVHFDTERAHGTMPAPMTTFAPAYPVLIGLLEKTIPDGEREARLLAGLCFVAILPLLALLGTAVGLKAAGLRIAFLFLLFNSLYLRSSDSVLTEPLFTLVAIAAILVAGKIVASGTRWWMFACAHLLVAAAYWIRYAGLFLFAAVLLFFVVIRPLSERGVRWRVESAWCVFSGSLIGLVMYRNYALTGSWKGGNTKAVSHPLSSVMLDYIRAQYHLLFGDQLRPDAQKAIPAFIFALAVAALIAAMGIAPRLPRLRPLAILSIVYVLIYTAGMVYLGKSSVITFGARMFYPMLPLYALGLAFLYARARQRFGAPRATALTAILLAFYGVDNFRDFALPRPPSLASIIRADMNPEGASLSNWIQTNLARDEPIAAMAGQATGFALNRPTLSLIGEQFSATHWDESTLIAAMRRFHIRYLILYKTIPDPVLEDSPFLAAAVCCSRFPGFRLAADSSDFRILEIEQAPAN